MALLAISACRNDLGVILADDGPLVAAEEDDDVRPRPNRNNDDPSGAATAQPVNTNEPLGAGGNAADDDVAGDDDVSADDDVAADDDAPSPVDTDDDVVDDDMPADDDTSPDDDVADDDTSLDDDVADDDVMADDSSADDDLPADDDVVADDDVSADDDVPAGACGNGSVEGTESCDDGVNDGSYGSCNADCTIAARCGDGAVNDASEACDDGNTADRDGCARDCTAWFDRDFTRRTRVDIENPVETAFSDFPVLVPLDATRIDWAEIGDGEPCFVAADGTTPLSYEKDVWDPAGTSLVWVRIPDLSSGSNEIWVYYGGADSDGCGAGSTWPDVFRGVFHLNDAADSSSYGHTMNDEGTADAPGVVGRGRTVDVDQALIGPSDSSLRIAGDLTISAWVSFSSLASGSYRNSIVTYGDADFAFDTNFQYGLYLTSNTSLFSYWAYEDAVTVQNTSSATTGMPLDEFHHLAMVRDTSAGVMRFYYDGAEVGTAQSYSEAPNGGDFSHLVVGGNAALGDYNMSGVLDEVRIAAWAAPSEWIAVEYASMADDLTTATMDP